ncbi:MAG: hypothetical protein ACE5F1_14570 [Planctomycetota bacterium]
MRYHHYLIALAALSSSLPSQNKAVYYPGSFEKREGLSSSSFPFGFKGAVRLQAIYQPRVPGFVPWTINQIGLRADWSSKQGMDRYGAKAFITLGIFLDQLSLPYDGLSARFADNQSASRTHALSVKLALPAQPPLSAGPRPFNIVLKLAKPFLVKPGDGNLLIDFLITDQPAGAYRLDSPFACSSLAADFGRIGPRCTSKSKFLALTNSPSVKAGGAVTWSLSGAPAGAPCVFALGSDPGGRFLGLQLPWSLGPFGAPDCYVNIDFIVLLGKVASSTGTAAVNLPIPPEQKFVHQWLHCQALTADISANLLGLVFSKGRKVEVCGPATVARVFALGANHTTGIVQVGEAPIVELK